MNPLDTTILTMKTIKNRSENLEDVTSSLAPLVLNSWKNNLIKLLAVFVPIIFILGLMYYCYGINIPFLIVKYGIIIGYFLGMKGFCILSMVVLILGLLYEIMTLILYNLICKNKIKIIEEIKTITIVDNYLKDLSNISKMGIKL